ncbi:MAG: tetratricopeptide repeat protein [Acidobacteria bacterium]|nr:tetratricopeptide repeat protein [Acidobacteriota bacterium]
MYCQACGAHNEDDAEYCQRCRQKLMVLSGSSAPAEESLDGGDEEFSFDEHLLERISILEEVLKRTGETVQKVLSAMHRQEESILVHHAGMLALRDLLERRELLDAAEWSDLWESKMDDQFQVLEKRERFAARKDRILGLYEGRRRPAFEQLLEEAELALGGLDLAKAMEALEKAAGIDRGNHELARFLGESHFQDGHLERSLDYMSRVLATKPDHVQGLVYSGVIRLQQGEEQRGQELLERAVMIHRDAFLPHFCLGASLAGRGQPQPAAAFLERAVEIDGVPQALYLLGRCRYEMGRLAPAIESLVQAVQIDPSFEECHHLLGLCYLDRGWNRKALTAFRTAQQLNPRRMRYRDLIAYLSGRTGAELPATSPAAADWVSRGEEAIASGDAQEALRCYREALALDPENPTLLMTYALACLQLDRSQEIAQLTQRVLDSNPGEMLRATAYATLIESLRSEGRYREGNKVGRRLLDEGGSNFSKSIAYYEMAYNLAEMDEDLDRALDFARRSLEHAPEELRQFPLAALGWVHYKRRELDEAIDFLSQSIELGPSTTVLTRLGMALLASGDEDGARRVLARARRLDDRGDAIEERMMEFMKDSARIIERVRGRA